METLFSIINIPIVSPLLAIVLGIGTVSCFEFFLRGQLYLRLASQLFLGFLYTQAFSWVVNMTVKSSTAQAFFVISICIMMACLASTFQLLLERKKL